MSALGKVAKALAKAAEKGLDTSPAARKARAVEQGYIKNKDLIKMIQKNSRDEYYALDPYLKDKMAYQNLGPDFDSDFLADPVMLFHGTAGDISSFNPNMLGRSTKAASAHHGTFLTNLSDDASEYAQIAKENNPLLSRKVNVLSEIAQKLDEANKWKERMAKYGAPQEHIGKNKEYISRLQRNLLRASQANEEAFPAVYPVHARVDNPFFVDMQGQDYGTITKNLSEAKKAGHDSVLFFDITDPTPGATHLAVFDPSRIRSIHAMFDPERINSRDLLASMAGLGGIGITDEMLEEQEPEGYAAGGLVKKLSKALIKGVEDFQAGKNSIRDIEIYKNPSYRDALGIAEEDGNFALRTLYDKVGDDVYVWPADQTLHDSIIRAWLMNAESGMKRHPSDFDRGLFELQGKKFVVPKDANVNPNRVDPAFWFKSRFEPEEYASGGLVKAARKAFQSLIVANEEVLKNPLKKDLARIARDDEYKAVRTLKDPKTQDVYAWPASKMTHDDVANHFGIDYDVEDMDNSDLFSFQKGKLWSQRVDTGEEPDQEMLGIFKERLNWFAPYSILFGTPSVDAALRESYPYE